MARDWYLSLIGPIENNHVGTLGSILIHGWDFPEGVHLATIPYAVAKEIVAAFPDQHKDAVER